MQFINKLLLVLLVATSASVRAADSLRYDPFARPSLDSSVSPSQGVIASQSLQLQLRGTVVAGQYSIANVDGRIYRIGDELSGYVVAKISEGQILLVRDTEKKYLTTKDKDAE